MRHLSFAALLLLLATISSSAYAQVAAKGKPSGGPLRNCQEDDSSRWPLSGLPKLVVTVMQCDDPGVIWIVAKRQTSSGYEAIESPHFQANYLGFNGIEVYDAHSFNVTFLNSRHMVTPINYEYAFALKRGVWTLLSASFDAAQVCGDDSIGDGSDATINYLSGKVHVDEREECKLSKTLNTIQKPQVISLQQFTPSDPPESF